jgi:hypothetical protein
MCGKRSATSQIMWSAQPASVSDGVPVMVFRHCQTLSGDPQPLLRLRGPAKYENARLAYAHPGTTPPLASNNSSARFISATASSAFPNSASDCHERVGRMIANC